jgi:sugar phosphate isomerase/epimerase
MIRLSGFADEIGPDIELQVRTLAGEGIRFLELRGVWGKNVLDFTPQERRDLRKRLADAGMGVSAIASPIGKVRIDEPWKDHVERFKIALDAAEHFAAPYIRLFSYYPPQGGAIAGHRDEVVRRLNEQVAMAGGRTVRLLHENEKDIYGEKTAACLDIARSVPGMDLIFDPANFVQVGVRPAEAWKALKDYVVYFHIKDALLDGGAVVPPGEGDGGIEEVLRDAIAGRGYSGFLSMEPHLAAAGQFSGFSGPDLFVKAVRALKAILDRIGAEYQ